MYLYYGNYASCRLFDGLHDNESSWGLFKIFVWRIFKEELVIMRNSHIREKQNLHLIYVEKMRFWRGVVSPWHLCNWGQRERVPNRRFSPRDANLMQTARAPPSHFFKTWHWRTQSTLTICSPTSQRRRADVAHMRVTSFLSLEIAPPWKTPSPEKERHLFFRRKQYRFFATALTTIWVSSRNVNYWRLNSSQYAFST